MKESLGVICFLLIPIFLVLLVFGLFRPNAVLPRALERTPLTVVRFYGSLAVLSFIAFGTLLTQLSGFFATLFLLCPIFLLVGLIRPAIVLPSGHQTRIKALLVFSLAWIASLIAFGITSSLDQNRSVAADPSPSPAVVAPSTPQVSATPSVLSSPEPTPQAVKTASTLAEQAQTKANTAKTSAEWEAVVADWNLGIQALEQVPPNSRFYTEVQTRLKEFQLNRVTAQQQQEQAKQTELAEVQRQQAEQQEQARRAELAEAQRKQAEQQEAARQQEQVAQAPAIGGPIREPYTGRCECPYDTDRAGRRCGGRSDYSRPGGGSPVCYVGE